MYVGADIADEPYCVEDLRMWWKEGKMESGCLSCCTLLAARNARASELQQESPAVGRLFLASHDCSMQLSDLAAHERLYEDMTSCDCVVDVG